MLLCNWISFWSSPSSLFPSGKHLSGLLLFFFVLPWFCKWVEWLGGVTFLCWLGRRLKDKRRYHFTAGRRLFVEYVPGVAKPGKGPRKWIWCGLCRKKKRERQDGRHANRLRVCVCGILSLYHRTLPSCLLIFLLLRPPGSPGTKSLYSRSRRCIRDVVYNIKPLSLVGRSESIYSH